MRLLAYRESLKKIDSNDEASVEAVQTDDDGRVSIGYSKSATKRVSVEPREWGLDVGTVSTIVEDALERALEGGLQLGSQAIEQVRVGSYLLSTCVQRLCGFVI